MGPAGPAARGAARCALLAKAAVSQEVSGTAFSGADTGTGTGHAAAGNLAEFSRPGMASSR